MPFKLTTDLEPAPSISFNDRGFHYGDGLFETMLLHDGEIYYWDEHYARLCQSAERLFIECPEKSWLEDKISRYIALNQTLVIKIILNRGNTGKGLQFPQSPDHNVYILKYQYELPIINQQVIAITSSITLPKNKNLAGLKHLNRLDYVLASRELSSHASANESILLDDEHFLVEGIIHNLFFVRGDSLFTPDLSLSGVDGIMRQKIIKKMKQDGINVMIGRFLREDLIASDECFMCNSVQGIRPIIKFDQVPFEIGPITQKLQHYFHGHTLS